MDTNTENPQVAEEIVEKPVLKNEKGQFVEGTAKPENSGVKKGYRSFEKDFDEVCDEVAKANNITNSEARKILIKKAYSEAKNGQYNFYKDITDRVYGKVVDRTDLTTGGEVFGGITQIIINTPNGKKKTGNKPK